MTSATVKPLHQKPLLRTLDYGLAVASLGYSAYLIHQSGLTPVSLFWLGAGFAGLLLAYINPAQYVNAWVKKSFSRKR